MTLMLYLGRPKARARGCLASGFDALLRCYAVRGASRRQLGESGWHSRGVQKLVLECDSEDCVDAGFRDGLRLSVESHFRLAAWLAGWAKTLLP